MDRVLRPHPNNGTPTQQRLPWTWASLAPKPTEAPERVALAISERLSRPEHLTCLGVADHLKGYVCHCRIATPGSKPLHVIGVYAPEELSTRKAIQKYCHAALIKAGKPGEHVIIAGDFNAVAHAGERSTGKLDTADKVHAGFLRDTGFAPICKPGARDRTYTQTQNGRGTHHSRIDDILLSPSAHASLKAHSQQRPRETAYESVTECGGLFDHKPLHARLPTGALKVYAATPPAPQYAPEPDAPRTWNDVVLPVARPRLDAAKRRMEAELTGETADLLAKLSTASDAIQAAVDAIQDPSGQTDVAATLEALRLNEAIAAINVEALAEDLQGALNKGLGLLLGECELKKPRTGKLHPNRSLSKKLRTLIREQTSAKDRLSRLSNQQGAAQPCNEAEDAGTGSNSNDPEQNAPELPPSLTGDPGRHAGSNGGPGRSRRARR
ncbi:hypothetical protein TSOC_013835 [Tetrabaena socialis]|uniref:Endonuclease/exonuclease/phosphatase domain-containing protein n=1 Tax=Tetrabaena socialis TaxID=47790 RepID=A0A2J7ZJC0_9CHLO|nr:hypothetical protein TSOC_013835 [Tetrabaena socialis]|eukprot:PNH00350.1 hypothetical protein TSOC_013835 [Tetrabaena socialis]